MLDRSLFKRPRNRLEEQDGAESSAQPLQRAQVPANVCIACPTCKAMLLQEDLENNLEVCPKCGHHMRVSPRQRIEYLTDMGTFTETNATLTAVDRIGFPGYEEKIRKARDMSGEIEGVLTGTAEIDGQRAVLFVMNPLFMMGSMGVAVGEKITRAFEVAQEQRLPVVGICVSGGARMQEGIFSLMQMAKTSAAVKQFDQAGGLYIALLTDPTTGGVTASFAMEADIILAEPAALIAFTGPRVIEQTIHQTLPEGFQSAEFLLDHGFVDAIVPRSKQRSVIGRLLAMHSGEESK